MMKPTLLAAGLALALPALAPAVAQAQDNSTLFVGFSWTFNAGPGATVKYLSTNNPNDIGVAAGVTYNFSGALGCDVGISSVDTNLGVTFTYDICRRGLQISGGALSNPQ